MSLAVAAAPLRIAERPTIARLDRVSKVYGHGRGAVTALLDVSLDLAAGDFLCIVGGSGCGKSTLLSLMAGLVPVTGGCIESPVARPALMFQEPALLPWLTARRNIELPLRLRKADAGERRLTVDRLLNMVGLMDFADSRPHELSGGMRQRVALARALAQGSELLLMDEPFAALDAITRDALHDDLTRIWETTGTSIVFVTHNVREAVRLGSRIVLLTSRPGRVAAEFPVDIPRPRRIESPAVGSLATQITARLREEVARHGHR